MPRWLLPDCHIRLDKNFPRNLFRILGMCSFVSPPNIMCGVVAPTILYHIWGLSKMRETENIILHDCKILQFPKHNATAADVIIFRRIEVCILRVDGLQSVCLLALNVPLIPCAITLDVYKRQTSRRLRMPSIKPSRYPAATAGRTLRKLPGR